MRINLTSVLVDDQDKALHFYTHVLGFQRKTEVAPQSCPFRHHTGLPLLHRAGEPVATDYYFPSCFCCRSFFTYSNAC